MIEKDTARQTGIPMRHSRRDTGLIILLLLLILALAAGLRFYNLGSQSLWSDEGNSAALATRSLVQIAQDAAHDIHPPLYYWLLRLWTTVFGLSEFALRSLSAVLGTLLVLVIYGLGARLFNRTTGLAAAFIAAIAPFQVYYSQEARMYILVALEGALAALLFWWFVAQEDARLPVDGSPSPATPAKHAGMRLLSFSGLLLTLVWVAGLYTHYAFPLMIGLLSLLYLAWLIVTRRRGLLGWRMLRWGLLLILTLVLYGPWLATAIQQLLTWPRVAVQADLWTQVRTLLATLTLGPAGEGCGRPLVGLAPAGAGAARRAALAAHQSAWDGRLQPARLAALHHAGRLGRRAGGDDRAVRAVPRGLSQIPADREPGPLPAPGARRAGADGVAAADAACLRRRISGGHEHAIPGVVAGRGRRCLDHLDPGGHRGAVRRCAGALLHRSGPGARRLSQHRPVRRGHRAPKRCHRAHCARPGRGLQLLL